MTATVNIPNDFAEGTAAQCPGLGNEAAGERNDASVVIPCHDMSRLDMTTAAARAALLQVPKPAQVVVVVDHNQPLLELLQDRLSDCLVVPNRYERGASGTRNSGAEHCATPIIIFLDDDAIPTDGWLSNILSPLGDPECIGVGGHISAAWPTREPSWFPPEFAWVVSATYPDLGKSTVPLRNVWSSNMAVRASLFRAVDGFRNNFGKQGAINRPEDTDLCIRMSRAAPHLKWSYAPNAVVHHHLSSDRSTFRYFIGRCFNEGRGKAELSRLVGAAAALSSERRYVREVLSRSTVSYLAGSFRRGGLVSLRKAAAVVVGSGAAALGAGLGAVITLPRTSAPERSDHSTPDHPSPLSAPAYVCTFDLSHPNDIPVPVRAGVPYASIWALVRDGALPMCAVSLPVTASTVTTQSVLAALPDDLSRGRALLTVSQSLLAANPTTITVVVCTRKNPEGLRRCLLSVLAQSRHADEILVIDNSPADPATRELVCSAAFEGVRYSAEHVPGLSNARNRALSEVHNRYVAWIDDDETADQDWLQAIENALRLHPDAAVVSGVMLPAELETEAQVAFERYGGHNKYLGFAKRVSDPTQMEQNPLSPLPPFGVGGNMATLVRALEDVGGFATYLGAGTAAGASEDTLLFSQLLLLGYTLVYEPAAITWHTHRASAKAAYEQFYAYGVGLVSYYLALVVWRPRLLARLIPLAPKLLSTYVRQFRSLPGAPIAEVPSTLRRAKLKGVANGLPAFIAAYYIAKKRTGLWRSS